MDPAMRGLVEACWVRHPTEWGGEENVVPPARDGQEARWTPAMRGLVEACWVGHPWRGGEERVVPPPAMGRRRGGPRPEDGILMMEAVPPRGRVLRIGAGGTPDRACAVEEFMAPGAMTGAGAW